MAGNTADRIVFRRKVTYTLCAFPVKKYGLEFVTLMENPPRTRHILSLSGGKDSSALAVYMRDRVSEMEYVFSDTGSELEETYSFLDKLEAYLGKPIIRLRPEDRPGANNGLRFEGEPDTSFRHYLNMYNGVLPDARTRWCTRMLKIRPFERYVGQDKVVNYVGIRADENRQGYKSTKPNIQARFPFVEDGIVKSDVERILVESGLGVPEYYKWRSRSGCYFCFFQQGIEWVGLLEQHPELFERAMAFEKENEGYSWRQRESLKDLMKPERVAAIKEEHQRRMQDTALRSAKRASLADVLADDEEDDDNRACMICSL